MPYSRTRTHWSSPYRHSNFKIKNWNTPSPNWKIKWPFTAIKSSTEMTTGTLSSPINDLRYRRVIIHHLASLTQEIPQLSFARKKLSSIGPLKTIKNTIPTCFETTRGSRNALANWKINWRIQTRIGGLNTRLKNWKSSTSRHLLDRSSQNRSHSCARRIQCWNCPTTSWP
jgi:hypothetical protein